MVNMMKLLKNSLIGATLLAGAAAMGTASAITLDSIPGVTGGSLKVSVDNGVATLFGNADSGIERELAKAYIEKMDNVERVIDLVTFN